MTRTHSFCIEAMVFAQLADAFSACSGPEVRHVRTTADPPVAPEEALKMLKDGTGERRAEVRREGASWPLFFWKE